MKKKERNARIGGLIVEFLQVAMKIMWRSRAPAARTAALTVMGAACNRIDDDDGKSFTSTSRSLRSSLVSKSVQKKGYNYVVGAAVQVALL